MSDNRDIKLNNLRALLVFLIVFISSIFSLNFKNNFIASSIAKFLMVFTMPMFCIISGYYARAKTSYKQHIRLFGLFMIMNFTFYIYEYLVTGYITGDIIKYSSWYVIDLIIWRLVYKQIKNKPMALIINLLAIIFLSIIPNNFKILNIDCLIYYFSYFLLGSCFNIFEDDKNMKESLLKVGISFLVIIITLLIFRVDYRWFNVLYNANPLFVITRIIFYVCIYFITTGLYELMPNKEIKLISNIGKCSLCIYFFHGFLTMLFSDLLHDNKFIILLGLLYALSLCIVLGNGHVNKFLKFIMELFDKWYTWVVLGVVILSSVTCYYIFNSKVEIKDEFIKYNVISNDNITDIKKRSISIGFTGNIVLLEEQLKNSHAEDGYNFDYMFKYVKDYFNDTNYLIANLEGISDDTQKYTLDKKLNNRTKVNVPSIIFKNLLDNNVDLVNVGSQRMLDYGTESLNKTLESLENIGLDYTGVYRNKKEERGTKIVKVEGMQIGILSYTYAPINIDEEDIFNDFDDIANFICDVDSRRFQKAKDNVEKDFQYLKEKGVDVIIVMPRNSYNASHRGDKSQQEWNEIFASLGADIVLGSNSNSTQRIEYIKDTLVVNSAGNFINNKYGDDSDLSIMVKVYVDKDRKNVNGVSIVPLYSYKNSHSGYVALPIYKAFKDIEMYNSLSQTDIDRMSEGLEIISKTTLDVSLNKDILEKEYFYFIDGYKRQEAEKLVLTSTEEKSPVYEMLRNSTKTCYVGDQYTVGSKNGGYGWFEPLVRTFDQEFVKISTTGYTAEDAANNYYNVMHNSNCDLFVVNIGANDIRKNYTNVDLYIDNVNRLLKDINKNVIMVAPWQPLEMEYEDINNYYKDIELFEVYNKRLKKYCDEKDCLYVNPNGYIKKVIENSYVEDYYNDYFYPNSNKGIELFSRSILN